MAREREAADRHEEQAEGQRRDAGLWFGVLAPAVAWGLDLFGGFLLVEPACRAGSKLPLYLLTAGTLALALAGGVVGAIIWRRSGPPPGPEADATAVRVRGMSLAAMLMSGFFVLVIVVQAIPEIVFGACE